MATIALFGGAQFPDKRAAFFVPLAAMFLSDLVIGLHALIPMVYAAFALIVCIGFWLQRQRSATRVAVGATASAVLLFVLANFGVWAFDTLYPKTPSGLLQCYAAAVPFLRNLLLGNLLYSALLFGSMALAENRFTVLREPVEASPA